MEFLIAVAVLVLGAYFGYKYYQAKITRETAPDIYVLPESAEVKVEGNIATVDIGELPVKEAAQVVDAVNEEIKKEEKKPRAKKEPKSPAKAEVAEKRTRKSGKFVADDKSTPDVNEAFKEGKAPAKKKKPTMKVVK